MIPVSAACVSDARHLSEVPGRPLLARRLPRLSMSLMEERLLKTLRYNFLTEALDFVGVHQEADLTGEGLLASLGSRTWGSRASGLLRTECGCPYF